MTHAIVTAELLVHAPADTIFALIADPAEQPKWDGNGNLGQAEPGQRVRAVGDVFVMHNANGKVKENHVTVFEEGRAIAWQPADAGTSPPPGHEWGWQLQPTEGGTLVRHSYDFSQLTDELPARVAKARSFTPDHLLASIERLKTLAESIS